jgi:hypothetical protein
MALAAIVADSNLMASGASSLQSDNSHPIRIMRKTMTMKKGKRLPGWNKKLKIERENYTSRSYKKRR